MNSRSAGLILDGVPVGLDTEEEKEFDPIPLTNRANQIRNILDALPFYALLVDADHRIVAANQKILEDFKISPQQLTGASCPVVLHGINTPVAECPLVEALEKGGSVERELFDSSRDQWIQAAVFPTHMVTDSGRPVYLHFARDITDIKRTEEKLSQSLEHHSALCDLLQGLQHCHTSDQILDTLIDKVVSLSWLEVTKSGAVFLRKGDSLEMRVQRNLTFGQFSRCKSLVFGECLCGKAAQTGRNLFCSSTSVEHTTRHEELGEHRHAVLPISQDGHVLGVLTLYLNPGVELNSFQLDFLNAAVSATASALAIQTAREEVKRVREKSMEQVISYQEDERKRVARELHDQVCQSLSALLLKMQGHGIVDPSVREMQRDCEMRIRGLIDEVQDMARQLRPTILDDYGVEMALARHIEELSAKAGFAIDYQCLPSAEQEKRLPAPIEVGLYRVAVEALDNIARHASASRASVILLRQKSRLMLLVEDDGAGFEYNAVRKDLNKCQGIIGMEERISLMGGTLRIESAPSRGTTIRADIPLKEN